MRLAAHGDDRFNPGPGAGLDIGGAEIAGIGQQDPRRAERVRQISHLFQHRLNLALVVGSLDHIGGHDQKAARSHGGLGVVALPKAAARHRHDPRFFVGEIDLVAWPRPFERRRGRFSARLLACRLGFFRPRCHFLRVFCLLALKTLFCPRLQLGTGFSQLLQALVAQRQFVWYRHAVGNVGGVGGLRLGQQFGDLGFQLRLDLARAPIRKRAVAAGIGMDLGAIQANRAQPHHAHLARQQQHLHEQLLDLRQKPPPEHRNRVVVGMVIGGDETKRHRIIARPFQLAAGKYPGGITVDQHPQQQARMIGL